MNKKTLTVETLISTMNRKDFSFIEQMNYSGKMLIINQKPNENNKRIDVKDNVKMITVNDKGLSKSRNLAIKNSESDIIHISDDDLIFKDNHNEIISKYHQTYYDYDIICFKVPSLTKDRPKKYMKKKSKIGFIKSMKISSYEITIKRENLLKSKLFFDENFGSGSGIYSMGEENIFLFDALKKGLKVLYLPIEIAKVDHKESQWFKGYTDKYFRDLGAIYYRMSKMFMFIFSIQYLIRKRRLFKERKIVYTMKVMLQGRKDYRKKVTNNVKKQ